ncbi:MAG: DNA polymerase I [Dehalococcoidia bacterium]
MTAERPLLLLFDGHALIHRAFHALPPLATRDGQPTGAVFGFCSMLLKTLQELQPTHCAVAFDTAVPTFRHEQFEDYKAQRPKAPDELTAQFVPVRELVEAFNLPIFEMEGFEADDILGTLSKQSQEQGIEAIVITGDTDMLQITSRGVRVVLPQPRGSFSDLKIYDEQAVQERYGLEARQLPDLKGLEGDASDNIPGVPGVGKKSAAKLIQQFGSVEGIYERIEEVSPPKLQDTLRSHEESLRQSKDLATIVTDVPVTLNLKECEIGSYDRDKVIEIFRRLEFHKLLDKLPETEAKDKEESAPATESKAPVQYNVVDSSEALNELAEEISNARAFAVDTETTGTDPRYASLVGISLSIERGKGWYIPVGHEGHRYQLPLSDVLDKLGSILADSKRNKIAHNAKYDMNVLTRHGFHFNNIDFDTMIAAHLIGEKALGLKELTFNKLGEEMTPISHLIGTGTKQISMAKVDIDKAAEYACADADMTFRLHSVLEEELKTQLVWQLFTHVEIPLVPVLHRMERNGISLDTGFLHDMSKELIQEMEGIEGEIYSWVGHKFNINSPQQLGKVLFEELRLPPARKTKSGYSTDVSVLETIRDAHPVVKYVIDYRQLFKLKSTYVDALPDLVDPDTGRIHTNFNQTATATGRLSSSDPNLQNIPVRSDVGGHIRQAFITPDDGHLLMSADYSQIELRIMAHLSQDPDLLRAFANDEDIHTITAAQVFGIDKSAVTSDMRRVAKTVNFGVIYGMSSYGLEQATDLSREQADKFIHAYFEKYSAVMDYVNSTKQHAQENGYVQTILGRRRYIPEIKSSNYQARQAAERMAINMPVQGTSADLIKLAMVKMQQEMDARKLKSKMVLQVHDELLFEVPREEIEEMKELVQDVMTQKVRELVQEVTPEARPLTVPLTVEINTGETWGEIK